MRNPLITAFAYGDLCDVIALPCSSLVLLPFTIAVSLSTVSAFQTFIIFLTFGLGLGLPVVVVSLISRAPGDWLVRQFARKQKQTDEPPGRLFQRITVYMDGWRMVNLSENLAEKVKHRMQYVKEHQGELKPWTVSISVKKEDGFLSSASRHGSDLVWYSDEPKERGGTGKGPSPLSYFLSSLGFCQMVHYVEHCAVEDLRLGSLNMKVEGNISPQRPVRFTDIVYEVQIRSGEADERIKKLARMSADDCYVTNTLRRSCIVKGLVFHNGKKIDEHL